MDYKLLWESLKQNLDYKAEISDGDNMEDLRYRYVYRSILTEMRLAEIRLINKKPPIK